ncbi:serine/threonine kinase [Aureococcus anophagefferens]|nr:serine/threonine kinase [Aureococcus anophagefferens]
MPPIDEAKSVAGPAGEYEALLRKVLADGLVHFQELGVVEDFERRGLGAADRSARSLFGWTPDEFRRSPAYGELLSLVLADGTVEAAERDLVAPSRPSGASRRGGRALQGLGWTDDDFSRARARARRRRSGRRRGRCRRGSRAPRRGGVVEYAVDELAAATDQWAAARRLGGGGFGDVFRGALRGGDVAIKRVHAQARRMGTTSLTGSWGYICPAFARTGRVAPSTDVFAFGVVLLEVLTGLPAIDGDRAGAKDLVSHAGPGAAATMARLDAAVAAAPTARTAADLAWRCLEDDRRNGRRPRTCDAIEELELEQSRQSFASRRPLSGATGRMLFGDEPATPRPASSASSRRPAARAACSSGPST